MKSWQFPSLLVVDELEEEEEEKMEEKEEPSPLQVCPVVIQKMK